MIKYILLLLLLLPSTLFAGEYCAEDYHGVCRDECLQDESVISGGFIDCGEKQVCCVKSPDQNSNENPKRDGERIWGQVVWNGTP